MPTQEQVKIVEQGILRYRDIFNKFSSPHNSLMYQSKLNNRRNLGYSQLMAC